MKRFEQTRLRFSGLALVTSVIALLAIDVPADAQPPVSAADCAIHLEITGMA